MVDASGSADVGTAAKSEDSTRGRPYYEKLRKDLKEALDRKRELDRTLAQIENNIARSENVYLEETSAAGNIIKGFDNYIKASSTTSGAGTATGGGTATRRKAGVSDQDRIFSRSSVSWTMRDTPAPLIITNNHASATPSEAATPMAAYLQSAGASSRNTPTASGPSKATKKKKGAAVEKKKDGDDTNEDSERPTKRGKVTWSGRD